MIAWFKRRIKRQDMATVWWAASVIGQACHCVACQNGHYEDCPFECRRASVIRS